MGGKFDNLLGRYEEDPDIIVTSDEEESMAVQDEQLQLVSPDEESKADTYSEQTLLEPNAVLHNTVFSEDGSANTEYK